MPNEQEETNVVEKHECHCIIESSQAEEREIYIGSRGSRAHHEAMEDFIGAQYNILRRVALL